MVAAALILLRPLRLPAHRPEHVLALQRWAPPGGHLGGGLAGAMVSVPLVWTLYRAGALRWLGWGLTAAVPLAWLLLLHQALAPERAQVQALLDVVELVGDPEFARAKGQYAPLLR